MSSKKMTKAKKRARSLLKQKSSSEMMIFMDKMFEAVNSVHMIDLKKSYDCQFQELNFNAAIQVFLCRNTEKYLLFDERGHLNRRSESKYNFKQRKIILIFFHSVFYRFFVIFYNYFQRFFGFKPKNKL